MPARPDPPANSWQNLYELACNETDFAKVAFRVGQAETAIFQRAREMGHDRNETTERQAMNRATHELLRIRTKRWVDNPPQKPARNKPLEIPRKRERRATIVRYTALEESRLRSKRRTKWKSPSAIPGANKARRGEIGRRAALTVVQDHAE